MSRSVSSLLAVLVLLLASQAAADGRGGGRHDDRDEDGEDREDGQGRTSDDHGGHGGRDSSDREEGEDHRDDEDEGRRDKDHRDKDHKEERRNRKDGRDPHSHPIEADPRDTPNGAPAVQTALGSDAGLAILPTALPGRAQFSFVVSSVAAADGLTLRATLPDTGSPWALSGPSAAPCRLEGLALECAFEGLAPGDVRLVRATSVFARAPPWELVASGAVTTAGDGTPVNDRARAGLGLLLA